MFFRRAARRLCGESSPRRAEWRELSQRELTCAVKVDSMPSSMRGERVMRDLAAMLAVAATGLLSIAASAEQLSASGARSFPQRILQAHNATRAEVGVAPLQWDNQLGSEAAQYAVQLALSRNFAHSAAAARKGAGENLWMGTRGAFSVELMVARWQNERAQFMNGIFPNIARVGSWHDVGHYTQMVWPGTRRVGCALAANESTEYLVCRYFPAGNVMGTMVSFRSAALRR